jgi:CRISPR/Cas system endoribonuclease Cas6 (RAMP superfamily)
MRSLSYAFRIGHSAVSEIVRETCEKIFETLSPIYLKQPDSNGWKKNRKRVFTNLEFP